MLTVSFPSACDPLDSVSCLCIFSEVLVKEIPTVGSCETLHSHYSFTQWCQCNIIGNRPPISIARGIGFRQSREQTCLQTLLECFSLSLKVNQANYEQPFPSLQSIDIYIFFLATLGPWLLLRDLCWTMSF